MRLIDDALRVCSGPYLAAPAERLRAALVALADAGMLTDPADPRPTTAGGLLATMTRPEACAARSTAGLACTQPATHDGAHEHHAADSDAVTKWAGWSE